MLGRITLFNREQLAKKQLASVRTDEIFGRGGDSVWCADGCAELLPELTRLYVVVLQQFVEPFRSDTKASRSRTDDSSLILQHCDDLLSRHLLSRRNPTLVYDAYVLGCGGPAHSLHQPPDRLVNIAICHVEPLDLSEKRRYFCRLKQHRQKHRSAFPRYLAV